MDALNIVLALISVISFGLAVYSFVQTEINKANERANIEVLNEHMKHLHGGLESLFYAIDALIQIPKRRESMTVEQMQDMARILRSRIYFLSEEIRKLSDKLDNWRFGKVLKSKSGFLRFTVGTLNSLNMGSL